MFNKNNFFIIAIAFIFLTCGKENDEFTSGVQRNTSVDDVSGTWFIFAGEFMDDFVENTPNFPDCGFDYIIFGEDGNYKEVLYNKFDCIPQISNGNWEIENGIILVRGLSGETIEFPVIEVSASELVINFQYDFDNNGSKDVFKAFLKPYEPIENYHVSTSFVRDSDEQTLLKFNWKEETDTSLFNRYEIFRSQEGVCSKENAKLIAQISDISQTSFIDYSPPPTQNNLCYYLKVFSNDILVGESELLNENPKELIISRNVNLKTPVIEGQNILLEWDEYEIPYFSHYEFAYANSDGSNLLFHEEDIIISTNNIQQTSLLNDPPYIENPYFAIYAYNIFGTRVVSNYEQVLFRRKDLIGPTNLQNILSDPTEPIVYFYGNIDIKEGTTDTQSSLVRYNYNLGEIENYSGADFQSGFESPVTILESSYGKEIFAGPRHFYNPVTLSEIFSWDSFYLFETFELFSPTAFLVTENDFWIMIDSDHVFVFRRENQELILVDKQIHYVQHHGDNYYRMFNINDNQLLIGHKEESESILFTLDENGNITSKDIVNLPLKSDYVPIYRNQNISFYSNISNTLISYADRILYSTTTFEEKSTLPQNFFALGLSSNGQYVLGSKNDPKWFGSDIETKNLRREVQIFDTVQEEIKTVKTKGYPIRIFENDMGELICVSVPENQIPTNFDVFVEKLNFP